jgi:2-polyprenyl-3-methyl-5-hydroxy-6-metoxy-1,4-benzoquinol methylase
MLEEFLNNIMIKRIQEYGGKEKFEKIFDIGGKNGTYTSKISEKLTVLDIKPKETNPDVNYIKGDILKFDTEDKFDVVVCSAILEHFTKRDGIKIVKKVNKFLEDDGLAFITCPNACSLNRMLGEMIGMCTAIELTEADVKVGHKYLYNLERLESIVQNNLEYVDSGSYFLKPLPTSEMDKLFDFNAFSNFASITSKTFPHLKNYLAEIFVVGKKLKK